MNFIAFAMLLLGLVIFAASLPLIYRKVPMNPFYGIRLPTSFESDERWHDINAYGGRQLAAWSWLPVVTGLVGLFLSPANYPAYAWCSVPPALLAVFIPVIRILIWSRRNPPRKASPIEAVKREAGGSSTRSVAERLRELEGLRAQRLVSEAEYEAKRQEILKAL